MASLFEKGFNKFADMGNALNKEANKLVGKEVIGEIKKIEEPKVTIRTINCMENNLRICESFFYSIMVIKQK